MRLLVHPHKIDIIKDEAVNEKEIDISKCVFEFDEEITEDYVKEAYFTLDKGETYKEYIVNNECNFPQEVLNKKGQVEIGVVAKLVENENEIKRYNPSPAYFSTKDGSLKEQYENSEEVTPTDKEQMEQMLHDGLEDINEAIQNAERLNVDVEKINKTTTVTITKQDGTTESVNILDGEKGEQGEQGIQGPKGDRGEQGEQGIQGIQGVKGDTGAPFTVKKTYPSVEAMNADFNNMELGDYVMIASSVEVEDNAKLYTRGESAWIFISDFSGAQGIKGEKGEQGEQGVQGIQGIQGIQGEKGDTGETGNGIASIIKTSTEGLVDTYTITYTDGTTTTFQITNGEDGSVTPTEFNALKERVEDLEDNQITLPADGINIHVEDAAKARLYEFEMDKESTQETTQGTNLIGLDTQQYKVDLKAGDKITLFYDASASNELNLNLYTNYGDTIRNDFWTIYGGNQRTITIANDSNAIAWSSAPIEKVWINKGETLLPYEEYTGGQPSPNPDYPQEVKTVKGYRNLFDENTIYNYTFDTSSGKVIKRNDRYSYVANVKPNTNYVISRSIATSVSRVAFLENFNNENEYTYISLLNISSNLSYTITTPQNCNYVMFLTGDSVASNLMLIEGDQELPYVPYGNNYILYKQVEKNLFDKDNVNILNNYKINESTGQLEIAGGWKSTSNYMQIDELTNYVLSGSISWGTDYERIFFYDDDLNYLGFERKRNNELFNFTTPAKTTKYRLMGSGMSISNIQLEKGTTATTYEEYKEIIVPLPLNGNELVGIRDYIDELLVDKSGHVFINKKTGKVVLNGSENWFMHSYNTSRTVFTVPIIDIENYIDSNAIPNLLCSHFISVSENATWKVGDISRTRTFNRNYIYLIVNPNMTVEDFKTWLSTHNTDVYYVLETPELIDLQTTVDLSLYKGVNNISNSEDGNMRIRYVESIDVLINRMDSLETRIEALEGTEL